MAIVDFSSDTANVPAGVVASYSEHYQVWTWKTHAGLCIRERERNMYDDSDFFMLVWDEQNQAPREIMFATTRGWSYPAFGSYVDATPEVREKYKAWSVQQDAARKAKGRRDRAALLRTFRRDVATAFTGQPFAAQLRFRQLPDASRLLSLFGKRIRSAYKLSLRDQISRWCNESSPRYNHPLSPRQRETLGS